VSKLAFVWPNALSNTFFFSLSDTGSLFQDH
jgi:hypothetical protein